MSFKSVQIAIKDISFYAQFWGLFNSLYIRLWPVLCDFIKKGTYSKVHNQILMSFLRKELTPVVDKYKRINRNQLSPIDSTTPIWVCWWQGEQNMPEMIRKCYQLLLKNSNGHSVNLITQENYNKYIEIPEIILCKLQNKEITFTFLSDFIRVSLIAKYGGVWIDSTYWVTQPLNFDQMNLFTYRQDRFKGSGGICDSRWTCHCIGTGKPYYIFDFIKDCFIHHLSLHKTIVEYLLIDFVINLAYEEFDDFRNCIDNLPNHTPHIYIMPWLFNQKLDIQKMNEILKTTPLLKMTYKREYKRTTDEGEPTYYDYFMSQKI